jgi:hypothetical protein
MSSLDLYQGPGANEPHLGFRILRPQKKQHDQKLLEPKDNLIQHALRDIPYRNPNAQMILLWRLTVEFDRAEGIGWNELLCPHRLSVLENRVYKIGRSCVRPSDLLGVAHS